MIVSGGVSEMFKALIDPSCDHCVPLVELLTKSVKRDGVRAKNCLRHHHCVFLSKPLRPPALTVAYTRRNRFLKEPFTGYLQHILMSQSSYMLHFFPLGNVPQYFTDRQNTLRKYILSVIFSVRGTNKTELTTKVRICLFFLG